MKKKKDGVAVAAATPKKTNKANSNFTVNTSEKSSLKRTRDIESKLKMIPRAYKKRYLKAVWSGSLRCAINAFCLECVNWKTAEVRKCPSLACPLWLVRPYQQVRKSGSNACDKNAKTTNEEREV